MATGPSIVGANGQTYDQAQVAKLYANSNAAQRAAFDSAVGTSGKKTAVYGADQKDVNTESQLAAALEIPESDVLELTK